MNTIKQPTALPAPGLSKFFTSFSGTATKKEFRKAFLFQFFIGFTIWMSAHFLVCLTSGQALNLGFLTLHCVTGGLSDPIRTNSTELFYLLYYYFQNFDLTEVILRELPKSVICKAISYTAAVIYLILVWQFFKITVKRFHAFRWSYSYRIAIPIILFYCSQFVLIPSLYDTGLESIIDIGHWSLVIYAVTMYGICFFRDSEEDKKLSTTVSSSPCSAHLPAASSLHIPDRTALDAKYTYAATLSRKFQSFSGVATKQEYRRAFLFLIGLSFLSFSSSSFMAVATDLYTNAYPSPPIHLSVLYLISFLQSCLYFIAAWESIKITIKRFHAFGESFLYAYAAPIILCTIPQAGILVVGISSRNAAVLLILEGLKLILAIKWVYTLFFKEAPVDKETAANEETTLPQTAHRQRINEKITGFSMVILLLLTTTCIGIHWFTPSQKLMRKLEAHGVNTFHIGFRSWEHLIDNKDTEGIRLLISSGASVNQSLINEYGHTTTPLHIAAEKGHAETAKLLIEAGADVDKTCTGNSKTPLYIAAEKGHAETAKLLIEAGADVDKACTGNSKAPLYIAAENGHTETVKLLIKARAYVNKSDYSGYTPLDKAIHNKHTEIEKILRDAGAYQKQHHLYYRYY